MNVAWNTRNVKSNWTIDMYACEKEEKNAMYTSECSEYGMVPYDQIIIIARPLSTQHTSRRQIRHE